MRLKIQSKNVILTIAVIDAVCFKDGEKKVIFELSGKGMDVYRFSYNIASPQNLQEAKLFIDLCEQIINLLHQGANMFECSFEKFDALKFEKFSPCSHID